MEDFNIEEPPMNHKEEPQTALKTKEIKVTNLNFVLLNFCISNYIMNMAIQMVIPFYPPLAHDEAGLNFTEIGIVFATSPLGAIFGGVIAGAKMQTWGRKRSLLVSLAVQAIAIFVFGTLGWFTSNTSAFFAVSILSRTCQGISRAVYGTVTFAYVPMFWPQDIQRKLGLMESMTALGLVSGPIVGAALNQTLGYSAPFIIMAVLLLLALIPASYLLPSDKNQRQSQQKKKLPMGLAFKSRPVLITMLMTVSVIAGLAFVGPLIVHHMQSFGVSQNLASLVYTIPTASYLISLNAVPLLQKSFEKSFVMSFGQILCIIGALLIGPFWTTSPNTFISLIIGFMFSGAAQAFSVLPNIPYLIEILVPIYNDVEQIAQIQDVASGLFITAFSLGGFISPILGGQFYDLLGGSDDLSLQEKSAFHYSCLILVVFLVISFLAFLFYGGGYRGWKQALNLKVKKDSDLTKTLLKQQQSNSPEETYASENSSQADSDQPVVHINVKKQLQINGALKL